MHFQKPESGGAGWTPSADEDTVMPDVFSKRASSSLAFGQHAALSTIAGPTYVTAQTLIQQVAYQLSDKIFTYSPDTFDLDVAATEWAAQGEENYHGWAPSVHAMQTRLGAGSIALGYAFSKDFDVKKRHIPQSLLGSTASVRYLQAALEELSLLYGVASPFVAHTAAVDYEGKSDRGLVPDYTAALSAAEELGLGLVTSTSPYESQHMALFSTALASVLPTLHVYDGISMSRDTVRVIDVMDRTGLGHTYNTILKESAVKEKSRASPEEKAGQLLQAFNNELGTAYELFEYHGHASPEQVLIVFGTLESSIASQIVKALAEQGTKIGVICVRVYRPFAEDQFLEAVPSSASTLAILGQVQDQSMVADEAIHSALYNDVLAAVTFSDKWEATPTVIDAKYPRSQVWTPQEMGRVLSALILKPRSEPQPAEEQAFLGQVSRALELPSTRQYIFWDTDESASEDAPYSVGQLWSRDSSRNVSISTVRDNLVLGGLKKTDIRTFHKTVDAPYPIDFANVSYVGDEKILQGLDILERVRDNGTVVLRLPGYKAEDVDRRLPASFRKALASRNIELVVVDPSESSLVQIDPRLEDLVIQVAFIQAVDAQSFAPNLQKLSKVNGSVSLLEQIAEELDIVVKRIETPEDWHTLEIDQSSDESNLSSEINANSFVKFASEEPEAPSYLRDWEAAAKGLTFKEAFGTQTTLRPDVSVKTWTAHVKENRRLTPADYDRNIFHIEFDLSDSGLKYDIGEALGVHGENNEDEVKEFMKFYGLEPEEIVEVPAREDSEVLEMRTVFQTLMQNLDIFGRPPKKFYESLAEFADDENERKELLTLGGPEGANEFKRRAEVDTITYADILLEFPSAHPSFHDIVRIVNPMKRREYSIASSQKVTPNSVALLVVVVGWVDPKGRDRFGQATRYLNKLKVGDPVTVSVKPSVMKLPPSSTQPLIMAGLGTGLAPFRAFVQYRAWQKAQGMDIGSVLLYMGSRHQREEYLYGEEWEAYQDAGIITLLGRAFSRDQPQKIYIQDRMRQTVHDIIQAYIKETGAFYLCGPTWPVPDVTDVLQEAIALDATKQGLKKIDPRKEIDRLKEEERYVLEVY